MNYLVSCVECGLCYINATQMSCRQSLNRNQPLLLSLSPQQGSDYAHFSTVGASECSPKSYFYQKRAEKQEPSK